MKKGNWLNILLIFALLPVVLVMSNYRLNYSDSEAEGIWRLSTINQSIHRGDRVALCHKIVKINTNSSCYPFLIKTVVGIPGDQIIINKEGIKINQKLLFHSRILTKQTSIYTLTTMITLPAHFYWVYGSNNAFFSLDSRYFGPVNIASIMATAYPVIIFHHHL